MILAKLKNLRTPIVAFLAFAVFSIGVLSVGLMHRDVCMEGICSDSACQSADCSQPQGDLACLSHCVSAVLSSVQSAPANMGINLYLLLSAVIFGLILFVINFNGLKNNKLSKFRLRQFYEQSKTAFYLQLGFWLSLIERKDYSYALILA